MHEYICICKHTFSSIIFQHTFHLMNCGYEQTHSILIWAKSQLSANNSSSKEKKLLIPVSEKCSNTSASLCCDVVLQKATDIVIMQLLGFIVEGLEREL